MGEEDGRDFPHLSGNDRWIFCIGVRGRYSSASSISVGLCVCLGASDGWLVVLSSGLLELI